MKIHQAMKPYRDDPQTPNGSHGFRRAPERYYDYKRSERQPSFGRPLRPVVVGMVSDCPVFKEGITPIKTLETPQPKSGPRLFAAHRNRNNHNFPRIFERTRTRK